MSRSAVLAAPSKVNLVLRVLQAREDGYHEVETLFQAIDLADEVRVDRVGRGVELEVRGADLGPSEQNLASRAAAGLRDRLGLREGVKISLTKRVPVGAGLGGGSSDAAAVLRCMADLFGVAADPALAEIGAELGSDVPFFLGTSPLAWGRGRGEVLAPLTPLSTADLVLVSPPVHVSTAAAYGALAASRRERPYPAPARVAAYGWGSPLGSWHDLKRWASNDFQGLIAGAHPEVAKSLAALERAGADTWLMSGSGSTCFGLFEDRSAARLAAERIREELGWPCRAVRTLEDLPRL